MCYEISLLNRIYKGGSRTHSSIYYSCGGSKAKPLFYRYCMIRQVDPDSTPLPRQGFR